MLLVLFACTPDPPPDSEPVSTAPPEGGDTADTVDPDAPVYGPGYLDMDRDGFGDPDFPIAECGGAPGCVADATDCDDDRPSVYPGAAEVCGDGAINDCGMTDVRDLCAELSEETRWMWALNDEGETMSVIGAGDVDGDGDGEVLAWTFSGAEAWLMEGTPGEQAVESAVALLWASPATWVTPKAAGDLDGDGFEDLLISNNNGSWLLWGPMSGAVAVESEALWLAYSPVSLHPVESGLHIYQDGTTWVIPGVPSGPLSTDDATLSISLKETSVSPLGSAGDFDGDGIQDVLVGAISDSSSTGLGAVVSGAERGAVDASEGILTVYGEAVDDYLGYGCSAGDFNDDGLDDVFIAAPSANPSGIEAAGIVYLVEGGTTGALSIDEAASLQITGESPWHYIGYTLTNLGDADGDGLSDVAVGTGWPADEGMARVAVLLDHSATGSHVFSEGTVTLSAEGSAMVTPYRTGDVDGDGLSDLVIAGSDAPNGVYSLFRP